MPDTALLQTTLHTFVDAFVREHALALPVPTHTVNELVDAYVHDYLPHQAKNTQIRKRGQFKIIRADLGTVALQELTAQTLGAWSASLGQRLGAGTLRTYLDTLSACLKAAVEDYEWLVANPMARVRRPVVGEGRVRCLDAEEQARLLPACAKSSCRLLYPLVLLAMTTGARKMECLMLRWEEIDFQHRALRLERTKTRLRRGVPIPTMTLAVLREWQTRMHSPYVFPGVRSQPPEVTRHWYRALRLARVEDFRFHDLRHTAASRLALEGVPIEVIAEILGHRSLETTRRYIHYTTAHMWAHVERTARRYLAL